MMTDETNVQGRCLCGSVQVTAKSIHKNVGACHCKMCRTWGGGPFMAVECGTDVSFEGGEHISVFDSSKWADRGFCNQCGTHLFYRIKESQQYMMPAGLFTDTSFNFDHQVFIDEKPGYYAFENETEDMTGAEIFAKYGAS
jgi:hypothetical protein